MSYHDRKKFIVETTDWERGTFRVCNKRAFNDLAQARHHERKMARRGVRRFGPRIAYGNWGCVVGNFGPSYRTVTIFADKGLH